MSCQIVPSVSFALAATEFHSLSPPCDHSADTPGPLIHQPGAFADGKSRYEGFRSGSCCDVSEMPRMFSASYQRYSKGGVAGPRSSRFVRKEMRLVTTITSAKNPAKPKNAATKLRERIS